MTAEHLGSARAMLGRVFGGMVESRSQGSRLWTEMGEEYLNCGGYGVFLLGAGHPAVVDAVSRQLHRHPVASKVLLESTVADAAARLASVTPAGLTKVYFGGSGTEATEAALKMAVKQGKTRFISMLGGYHGKTIGSLSVTGNETYQGPFRPVLPASRLVTYGDVGALREALADAGDASCVILEPIQGEAGAIVPPSGYLRGVAAACREFGALLIVDEIMTGLGRTGSWWASEAEGVVPDILLTGKSLGGGVVPASAAVTTAEIFAPFDADFCLHTSTFSGSPMAMAAVSAALDVIEAQDLPGRAHELGQRLLPAVREICERECPGLVAEVRGRGLLIGIELTRPDVAAEMLGALIEQRVLVNHSLNSSTVLRLTPPAIFSAGDEEWLLRSLTNACRAVRDQCAADVEGNS
ncbi:MAG: aminotransferase class III-fold pyridoxal phosphate-dependent enzyme [Actinomycetota bacterium]|nr:aminotransferase class III-fold pyridoxal phosphate-dependent enzyme [Actinomycetota bacterium]